MRTFIAFTLPDEIADAIIDWQQQNMPEGVFPEPVTNLHMTLAFLGETPDELVPHINQILSRLDISQVQISGPRSYTEQAKLAFLEFDEVGGTAVWEQINKELYDLMGYEPQFRPWLPHTTVWRYAPDHKPNINPPLPTLTFVPTAATLYQSVRNENGQGATYQHVGNILDPIEPELDQTVYQGTTPKKSVQDFIKRIYYRALDKELKVNGEKWADLYLTGSLTTYQYSVTSDCDISVFPNYDLLWKELGLSPDEARKELISLSINHIDGTFLPGTTHPLQFFVVPHGTLPSDLYKPGLRSAYDLHDSMWFQKPEKDRVHDIAVEYPDLFKRAEDIGDKLTQMLDAGDDTAAKELWHQIHKKRQLDQQAGLGDFCEGNIVYKYLLNEGLFDRIRSELGEYIAAVKWSMPPAAQWEDFADSLEERQHNDLRGEAFFVEDTGMRWRYNHDTLKTVTHLLGEPITFDVSRRWMQGYGTLAYRIFHTDIEPAVNRFIFTITLNQILSPEAAAYSLWHEIQHAFQLVEGRMEPGHASPTKLTPDVWEDYITDPAEVDADAMAAKMRMVEELPVVDEIPITEGAEKEYYEELIQEGWPPDEALDMLTKEGEEISLQEVIKNRQALGASMEDLWEDRVTQKVIYDFDKDTITLGTQATDAENDDTKIVGEYKDGIVTLYGTEKQWITPSYFHRLWAFSYPNKELKDVYYKQDNGPIKLRTVRKPKQSAYVFEQDEKYGMGLERDKHYGMVWTEDQPVKNVTFKGIYTVHGEPYTANFWYDNNYQTPVRVMYDHFVWMMENNMIFPLEKSDTLNYIPWSDEEQQYYREANVPKFLAGDSVIMKAYGESGTIMGEPHFKDGDWWYWVRAYDSQGPVGDALYPESDMERPKRYDQPAEMTLKDMFGIPPEGEQYYRDAGYGDKWKDPAREEYWLNQIDRKLYCPTCGEGPYRNANLLNMHLEGVHGETNNRG